MRKLILTFIFSIICLGSFAQLPTLQQKLYYSCKVWGFVKFYHSNTCSVNWDSVLLHTLPLIRSAGTGDEFNDALDTLILAAGPMTVSGTYFPDTLPAELKRNRDWSWTDAPMFRSDVQALLDTIRNNFRPAAGCNVMVNPFLFSGTLADPWGGYLLFPGDTVLLHTNTSVSYPDADHRQLMLFKQWNIISYFNPYNYILDVPWDTTLCRYAVQMDETSDAQALYTLCIRIATALNDAHVFGLTGSTVYQQMPGFFRPALRLKYADGQYVVTRSLETGINPGDVITSADGLTPVQWEDSLRQFYSSGNTPLFRRSMCVNMLGRQFYGATETLVVQDTTGASHTYVVNCGSPAANIPFFYNFYYPADSLGLDTVSWETLSCGIGYVNMGNLQMADVNNMYNDLKDKSAIIFDVRNYPHETITGIASLLFPGPVNMSNMLLPDVTYPGTYYWQPQIYGTAGNTGAYTGKVIILMNEETQSEAEYTCMILGAMPGAVKVGSQTAGADGDVTWLHLTDDLKFGWTSIGVFYPNGDSTQRIGVVPDSVVYATRAGIAQHRDEVLDKALSIAGCGLGAGNIASPQFATRIYPNPASTELNIETTGYNCTTVTISNTLGQAVYSFTGNTANVHVDIARLPAGVYFVRINGLETRKFVKE